MTLSLFHGSLGLVHYPQIQGGNGDLKGCWEDERKYRLKSIYH